MPRQPACQTCRARKVKCDRLSPSCTACSATGQPCVMPSTSPEITWLIVGVDGNDVSALDGGYPRDSLQKQIGAKRRLLLSDTERARQAFELQSSVQHVSLIEDMLVELESQHSLVRDDSTWAMGPFGVFRLHDATPSSSSDNLSPQLDDSPSYSLMVDQLPFDGLLDSNTNDIDETEDLLNLPEESLLDLTFGPSSPTQVLEDLISDPDNLIGDSITIPPTVPISWSSDVIDLDIRTIRQLLERYEHFLVPCLSPVRVRSRSPWKKLNIPKVHEALGEIIIRGDAGNSKVALLFSILGASAYHADTVRLVTQEDPPWRAMAERYRELAKVRLKICLQELSMTQDDEAYEDLLTALLSMVTTSAVGGRLQECHTYLSDVEHLISLYGPNNMPDSTSSRILLSNFLYLRTLQVGGGMLGGRERSFRPAGSARVPNNHLTNLWSSLVKMKPETSTASAISRPKAPCMNCDRNKPMFVEIYSLPESLFLLISRVTTLLHNVEDQKGFGSFLSDCDSNSSLFAEASQLELAICDWKNECPDPEKTTVIPYCDSCTTEPPGESYIEHAEAMALMSLVHHCREAMHCALLIYFYRCIRNVDTYMLQPYVSKTAEHLARYAQQKQEISDLSSNVCWPGFIAGCEAVDPEMRQRFSTWFSSETTIKGIRMFSIAGQAVQQVWEARDRTKNRNLPWSQVLRENSTLDQLVLG